MQTRAHLHPDAQARQQMLAQMHANTKASSKSSGSATDMKKQKG